MLAVLINSSSTDNLQFTTSQSRLDNIGRINTAFGTTGANNSVQLVNKENNPLILFNQLQQFLHTPFKFTSVLGACYQHAQLQGKDYFPL